MKLTQAELDTLSGYHGQLLEMRTQLKTFDLQVDESLASRGIRNELQQEFNNLHNELSSIASTMERRINIGAFDAI